MAEQNVQRLPAEELCRRELEALIGRSRGRSNKDLAKLADQLKRLMEQWDS